MAPCGRCCTWRRWLLAFSLIVLAAALGLQWPRVKDVESYYKGKRVVITGASKGIGRGLALRLSQLGARLVITARTESILKEVEQECARHCQVVSVVGSVGEEEDCRKIVNTTIETFGGVDILILNAAYSPHPTLLKDYEKPADKFLNVFKVNTLQSVYLTSMFLEELERSEGIVIGVSSVAGLLGFPKVSPYSTSKHALHGFFSSLHSELRLQNSKVTVTLMPLPYVRTEKAVTNMSPYSDAIGLTVEDCVERMLEGIPLRHFFHYITWDTFAIGHLNSLSPDFFNWIGRVAMMSWFEAM